MIVIKRVFDSKPRHMPAIKSTRIRCKNGAPFPIGMPCRGVASLAMGCLGVCGAPRKSQILSFSVCGAPRKSQILSFSVCGAPRKLQILSFSVCGAPRKSQILSFDVCGAPRKLQILSFDVCGAPRKHFQKRLGRCAAPVDMLPSSFLPRTLVKSAKEWAPPQSGTMHSEAVTGKSS